MLDQNNTSAEDLLGPPRIDLISIGMVTLASFVSGALGGIFILVCTFFFLSGVKDAAPVVFPYILSLVAFVGILISLYTLLYLQRQIFPDKYPSSSTQVTQTFLFSLILYLVLTPLYVYMAGIKTDALIVTFTIHALLAILGTTLIVEILSQYRYSLLSIYASFIGFSIATFLAVVFHMNSTLSESLLYALSGILIVGFTSITFVRVSFEFLYSYLYQISGQDILGNVFAEIEADEKAREDLAQKSLTQF